MIDWFFRNRRTGERTIAQFPNVPLGVFLVAVVVRWIASPSGAAGTMVDVVAAVALIIWAGDEVIRGVNPWRRMLGGGVLGYAAIGFLTR